MRRKQSRFGAREETVDIETAVKMLIARLLETGELKANEANAISREKLNTLIRRLSPRDTAPAPVEEKVSSRAPRITRFKLVTHPGAGTPPEVLTPNRLAGHLAPYLNAIINIQNAIDELRGLPLQKIGILSIQGPEPLQISSHGAAEAVQLVREIVIPWRRKNYHRIRRVSTGQLRGEIERKTIDRGKIELASRIIRRANPNLSEQEKFASLANFLPALNVLIFSDFELE